MDEIQKIAWIDRYLRGDLEKDEKERFEAQYRNDPEFAEEVDLLREVRDVAGDEDLLALSRNLRSSLKGLDSAAGTRKPRKLISLPLMLAAAAAITLVVAAVYWFRARTPGEPPATIAENSGKIQQPAQQSVPIDTSTPGQPTSPTATKPSANVPSRNYMALARTAYRTPDFPVSSVQRGDKASSGPGSIMQQAYEQFGIALQLQSANPDSASELFSAIVSLLASPPDSISTMAHYVRGHARFQLKQYKTAAKDFENVARHDGPERNHAIWYQALCLLALGEPYLKEAGQLLSTIANGPPSAHRQAAGDLLVKIQFQ